MKRYVRFVLAQAVELWIWWLALGTITGAVTNYKETDIFWLYIVSFIASLAAMYFVRNKGMKKQAMTYKNQDEPHMMLKILLFLLPLAIFIAYLALDAGTLASFAPTVAPLLIGVVFITNFVAKTMEQMEGNGLSLVKKETVTLALRLGAMIMAAVVFVYMYSQVAEISFYIWFVVLVVPINIFLSFGQLVYENRGGDYSAVV